MNKTNKLLTYIISISFIMLSLLSVVHLACFDTNFYDNEHKNLRLYGKTIAEHIGISESDLHDLTVFTLNYLNDPKASLDKKMNIKGEIKEVFNDDEKMHMVDVRKLNLSSMYLDYVLIVIFVFSLVFYLIKYRNISNLLYSYKKVFIFFLIIFAFIGLWILIDFDAFWTSFHHLFFSSNNLWLLDLNKDVLIMIVPPEFFNHLVSMILISFLVIIFLVYFILLIINRRIIND